jgi:hypothetical protein
VGSGFILTPGVLLISKKSGLESPDFLFSLWPSYFFRM